MGKETGINENCVSFVGIKKMWGCFHTPFKPVQSCAEPMLMSESATFRFGDGYTVIIRVSGEFPDMDPVMQYIESHFPGAILKERHHNMLQYQLGSDIKLSALFGQIEAVRDRLSIEDYSVSQTTLDQVKF